MEDWAQFVAHMCKQFSVREFFSLISYSTAEAHSQPKHCLHEVASVPALFTLFALICRAAQTINTGAYLTQTDNDIRSALGEHEWSRALRKKLVCSEMPSYSHTYVFMSSYPPGAFVEKRAVSITGKAPWPQWKSCLCPFLRLHKGCSLVCVCVF